MLYGFDARQADEGRSFLSKKGGGNKLGEKLFDERVNIWADPWDPDVPCSPWDGDACRRASACRHRSRTARSRRCDYSRYWAQKQGKPRRRRARQHDHGGRHQVAPRS